MNYLLRRSPFIFRRTNFLQRRNFSVITPQNPEILDEVYARVFQVMRSAAKCRVEKLDEKASFEDLGFDSLDGVEMVVALEENFGFDITHEEAERIQTVQDAIAIFYKYTIENLAKEGIVKKDDK